MVSLGQNFKMPKTCEKPFYNNIRVCSLQKTDLKSTNYSKNEAVLKMGHFAETLAHAKAIAVVKSSVWVKN